MASNVTFTDNAANTVTLEVQKWDIDDDRKLNAQEMSLDRVFGNQPPDPVAFDVFFITSSVTLHVYLNGLDKFITLRNQLVELNWKNPPVQLLIGGASGFDFDIKAIHLDARSTQDGGGDDNIHATITCVVADVF